MRLAALLARKDLLQTARDRLSFVFILVMPLAFTLFFGLLFGADSSTEKLPLAVWDADGGAAAKQLVADLGKSAVVRAVVVKRATTSRQWMADERPPPACSIPKPATAPRSPTASRPSSRSSRRKAPAAPRRWPARCARSPASR